MEGSQAAQQRATFDEKAWSAFLSVELAHPWVVVFGRSRTVPVQARFAKGVWELRLHGMFAAAPADVRAALAKWLRSGRRAQRAGALLDAFIEERLAETPRKRSRARLEPRGVAHDLELLATRELETEFAEDFGAHNPVPGLTWGRRGKSRSRRSLRLGSYDPELRLVRLHTVMDQAAVPCWFVRFVLKHELLHAVHPPARDASGRWIHHGPDFRARESSWPEYAAALEWEERNLPRLIRSARNGTPLRIRAADLVDPQGVERRTERKEKPRESVCGLRRLVRAVQHELFR